ncbi:MAG: Tol-Pal system beta propeller repeat protein TolB [Myxococcota bacterium]
MTSRLLLCLGLFVAALQATPAMAQSIRIRVAGSADVPLAAPKVQLMTQSGQAQADQMWDAMYKDLTMSGYFKMLDPSGYVEKDKGVEPGAFDFDAWRLINTTVLVKSRMYGLGHQACDRSGKRICVDVFVYNAETGDELSSKQFRGVPRAARYLGHAMANHVIEVTTGIKGWFGSRFTAVGNQSGNKEIYVMDSDGQNVLAVTRNGAINLSPAFSPSGSEIAWTSYKKSNPDLYVKDLRTGATRTLSNVKGVNTSPAFSPDGSIVALSRSVGGESDIFLLNAKTGAVIRQLTTGGGIDVSPVFTPNGKTIVFASERGGGAQVYTVPVLGGTPKRLTFTGDFNIDPALSPDGKRFAWVGRSEGGFDVYVADLNGRNVVRLTQGQGDNEDPTWTPDSKYVMFSSTRTGRSELWLSTADGRHQTQVTKGGGWTQPSWTFPAE